MCSGKRLFNRDIDDNLGEKDQQRLVDWAGLMQEEQKAVLGDCKEVRLFHRALDSHASRYTRNNADASASRCRLAMPRRNRRVI